MAATSAAEPVTLAAGGRASFEAAHLRLAALGDAGRLAELARAALPGCNETGESMREWLERGGALVLEHPETGSIVSFLRWREQPGSWRIEPTVTAAGFQGEGYDRWLMTKLEALAIRRNIPSLSLELDKAGREWRPYYERMGYRASDDASSTLQKRVGGVWQQKVAGEQGPASSVPDPQPPGR